MIGGKPLKCLKKMSMKMNKIEDKKLKLLLVNPRNASKNHYQADCPFCLKGGHFYINRTSYKWDCKKCSEYGNLFKFLKQVDALEYLEGVIEINRKLEKLAVESEKEDNNVVTETVKMPRGFKRLYFDEYLQERGFKESDYKKYVVGRTEKERKLKDYIIIGIIENGNLKGYLSRVVWDKRKMEQFENRFGKKKPKYMNSDASFSKLLGGSDEINFLTKTVLLVEGFFDKKNVDDKLKLDKQNSIKCCYTFGKKISKTQISKLSSKGVKRVILIQDPDAIKESKNYSKQLQKLFEVRVGFIDGNEDIGDMSLRQIKSVLSNLKKPENFIIKRVQKRTL